MPPRIPPGRAGRTWLVDRLQIARRGAELLDRKRQALLHEQARVRAEADAARGAWREAVAHAELWSARAKLLDGAGRLDVLSRHVHERATIELSWSNLMGAHLPSASQVAVPDPPALSALGASSAAVIAARTYCEAARAAARYAVAARAHLELSAELARATRRLRALQTRWIPQHELALAQLDLVLDESQREQAARVRWLIRRRPGADRGEKRGEPTAPR
jgi:V/A-type H+/Na+-transporting ATPase subunit D